MNIRRRFASVFIFTVLVVTGLLLPMLRQGRADEGMWTFDNLPLQQLQQRYGFTPD
jgi:hypothetical protein